MVPPVFHFLLVKQTMQLVEVRCPKCGRHRVLPRNTRLERVHCHRCGRAIILKRVPVKRSGSGGDEQG
jgi:ribosomal protein S27E